MNVIGVKDLLRLISLQISIQDILNLSLVNKKTNDWSRQHKKFSHEIIL